MIVHTLSRAEARRIAVRAQLLAKPRPTDLLDVIRHLTVLQVDQTAAVAPSADLVLWSRLGPAYAPAELESALDRSALVDLRGMIRPGEDLALYRAEMALWPGPGPLRAWQEDIQEWFEANERCRRDILDRLEWDGPLPARELPDTCARPWKSTGWTNEKNVTRMLDFMEQRGEVAVAGRRQGRERTWDLAERVYPDDNVVPYADALRIRQQRRLQALGIARVRAADGPSEQDDVGEAAVVDGVRGTWRVDPEQLERSLSGKGFKGRAALLSPFDRLVYDRKRTVELFEFDYQLEMYKPAAQRRWGYYALPILYGDRLVGKLDATADREAGTLFVDAIHEDEPFAKAMTTAVRREINDLAAWLKLKLSTVEHQG